MSELSPDESSIAAAGADPGRRKAAAHEARGTQTFAVTSAPAATPIADMVEAMVSGGSPVEVVVLAVRTAELARGGTDPVAERRRAFDRERKRRASAKAPPPESQHVHLLNFTKSPQLLQSRSHPIAALASPTTESRRSGCLRWPKTTGGCHERSRRPPARNPLKTSRFPPGGARHRRKGDRAEREMRVRQ
jgi:hypothetical protein